MKTKKIIQFSVFILGVIVLTFTSCKKDDLTPGKIDPVSIVQLTADENDVEGIMNDAMSDVASLMGFGGGLKSTAWKPCHGTVDSTTKVNDTTTFYINYNGVNCNERSIWNGKIEVRRKSGVRWNQAGAAVIFKYINLSVTNIKNNKTIILNGTKTFTNVSGGLRWQVGAGISSYVETVNGSMQASFENGTARTWNVARKLTYTGTPLNIVITIDGFGTTGEYTNLVVWGTNRQGEQFFTQIIQSVVRKQACDGKPVSGIKKHQIPGDGKSATVTYGYNDNNEPVTGDTCPTKYRVDWQKGNATGTSYFPL